MLVLTVKRGEKVFMDNDIEILVLKSGKNQIELGITAPKTVNILRERLYKKQRQLEKEKEKETSKQVKLNETCGNCHFWTITNGAYEGKDLGYCDLQKGLPTQEDDTCGKHRYTTKGKR